MGFKALHGLEMAEIGLLGLTALGLVIAIASGQWLWAAIAFWLTLALNLFNRLRGQWFARQQLRALKHQQRQLLDEKLNFSLMESASTPNDPSTTPSTTAAVSDIQSLKLSVAHLEQSLAQVWQGLQRSMGGDRPQPPAVVPPGESIPLVAPSPAPDASEPKPLDPNPTVQKPKASPSLASPPSSPSQPLPEMGLLLRRINWQPDRSLENHLARVSALSLSRDGRYLASGSWDQTLKVWDLKTGQCLGTIHAHGQGIQAVAFAGDHKIVTGSYDQQIKIWSLTGQDSGEIEFYLDRTLTAHTGSVHALAVTADEKTLVSGSYDQTIKRWDLENAELGVSSYDPSGAIAALALDPKAQWIASAGGDGLVTLWPMNSRQQAASPKNDNAQNPSSKIMTLGGNLSSVESLAVSPDGQTLAAGCGDGTIKLWTIPDSAVLPNGQRRPSLTLVAHPGPVTGLCFTAAGYGLYSSGVEGQIKLWQPTQSEAILTLQFPRPEPSPRRGIFSLILTPDEQTLIAGGENGTIQTWRRE